MSTTTTNNSGNKLKATMNQENLKNDAIEAIRKYLSAVNGTNDQEQHNSTLWALSHLLYPAQTNSEAEDLGYLLGKIIAFLFHPERLTAFFKTTGFQPHEVYKSLTSMQDFFEKMSKDGPEAEMVLFNLINRKHLYDSDSIETERNHYTKSLSVEEAKIAAFGV